MLFKQSHKSVKIGNKSVPIRKITIAQWKELSSVIQSLPQLVMTVINAPANDRTAYIMVAIEEALDDVIRATAILTGLDAEYIEANASIDELFAFYAETFKVNNFAEIAKNVQSVLMTKKPEIQGAA